MKRTTGILFAAAMALLFFSFAPHVNLQNQPVPQLSFVNPVYDFGTVYTDALPDTKVDIPFTNTGNAPLLISGVRACCGTRVMDWPKEPILPGDSGVVQVNFRLAANPQSISRTVTITYNNPDHPSIVFRIIGRVVSR